MAPRGKHAVAFQGYDGKVGQVAVVKNRKLARRVAADPGCLATVQQPPSYVLWSIGGACLMGFACLRLRV